MITFFEKFQKSNIDYSNLLNSFFTRIQRKIIYFFHIQIMKIHQTVICRLFVQIKVANQKSLKNTIKWHLISSWLTSLQSIVLHFLFRECDWSERIMPVGSPKKKLFFSFYQLNFLIKIFKNDCEIIFESVNGRNCANLWNFRREIHIWKVHIFAIHMAVHVITCIIV